MAHDYNPKDATNCFPADEYPATLIKSEDKVSQKSGNPMEVWTFRVYGPDGREALVTEYVSIPAAVFKIKQLATAMGRKADFDAGRFHAEDHLNTDVRVALTIEEQDGYDDKNRIAKFLPLAAGTSAPAMAGAGPAQRGVAQQKPATSANRAAYLPDRTQRPAVGAEVLGQAGGIDPADIPF